MFKIKLFLTACVFFCLPNLFANTITFPTPKDYINHLNQTYQALGKEFNEWTPVEGDLNGDGIADYAMILSYSSHKGTDGIRTRLVVLTALASGGYKVLSESAQYCQADKFYNLSISASSLYVEEVFSHSADRLNTSTLQFRFNKKLGDFEAIGRESRWESETDRTSGRDSENYLTGWRLLRDTLRGRVIKNVKTKIPSKALTRLNGFDCEAR